ncbi:MAG TPA: hypothetical protein VF329_12455 [Gammaproteobacteria bacterium]
MPRSAILFVLVGAVLAGCESGSSTGPEAVEFTPAPPPSGEGFVAVYAPPIDVGPYPSDLYNPTGQKLEVPERITSPLAEALNTLDGFSTTAPITVPFNGPVDPETLVPFDPANPQSGGTVFVLNATAGTPLVPGLDYDVRVSTAAGTGGGLVEIVPLVPLEPRTQYAFILTDGIENTFGEPASADTVFGAVRDAHLAGLGSVPGTPELDPLFPAITPLIDAGVGLLGIPGESIVVAWSMRTQSVGDVLEAVSQSATARPAVLEPLGISTGELGLGLPGIADVYAGTIAVPYFGDPANPLASFWVNADLMPPNAANPVPVARVPELPIPLLATLPNAQSGHPEPAEGWPVVIYVHGITSNRTTMFAIADSFAAQGFAVVAIDLPLHGVRDTESPFYQGPGTPFGDNERHFNLDNVGDTGVFVPDGEIDNGWQILNLQNPLNARDNLRQAVSDLIQLARTIPTLDFDGDQAPDLDASRIHFVGASLGSIIGSVFLGVDTDVRTATLSSPAGPWTAILTDPEAVVFGDPIRDALAAQGLPPGTANFDNFVRDLQAIIDPVDPVNYAVSTRAFHPLHVIEVRGDTTVPNAPTDYLASLWGLPTVSTDAIVPAPGTVSGIVRFTAGGHGSLLDPSIDRAVTTEMQTQAVTYAASNGSVIPINDTSLVE